MDPAPLFTDIQGLPDGGEAHWRKCPDGTRVRMAVWKNDGAETALVFPGRTEYIEKYGPVVRNLLSRGYDVAVADWRGQGLSDRHPNRPQMGHVGEFADYQQDVAELLGTAQDAGLAAPTVLLAHSMGGAIGLRALMNGLSVQKVVFSGPMWNIHIEPSLRIVATLVAKLAPRLGFGGRFIPLSTAQNYVEITDFDDNTLTNDPETYKWLQGQLARHPELGLGGPSCHWFSRALAECADLTASPLPDVSCLCLLGTKEAIVSPPAVKDVMARWTNGKLYMVEGGQHECFMEPPDMLKDIWAEIDVFLEKD